MAMPRQRSRGQGQSGTILVDAHVHVHPCFDVEELLNAARSNFGAARQSLACEGPGLDVLLLTECAGDGFFRKTLGGGAGTSVGGWSLAPNDEPCSLTARGQQSGKLILVAGRQVATRDGLEVLALGSTDDFADGLPIAETLRSLRESGVLAAIPWGFGKWWLRRGRLIRRIMEEVDPSWFFLGDNGGRPRLGPRPVLFRIAANRGIRILPGTDPLPFPEQARRAGSYGFVLTGKIDTSRPWEQIRQQLTSEGEPVPYGAGEHVLPFFKNQVRMQLLKRTKSSAS